MSTIANWRRALARIIAPRTGVRLYSAARNSRLTSGWGASNGSSDTELISSLTMLRSRSRALVRDAAYAKRARSIVQNNVVGTGIGMQAQVMTTRDDLNERVNAGIEAAWLRWCRAESCHTGGALHFADLERALIGQVFEAGEVFVRKHPVPFGDSKVPFALELVEAERIADEWTYPPPPTSGANLRMGVEVDSYGRPVAYWVRERHPGEVRLAVEQSDRLVRVPADQMIHLRIVDRWPQTRGEPWLHAVARKLNDMDGYSEAEIVAARGAASYMGFIESPDMDTPIGEQQADGTQQLEIAPGAIDRLGPGEKFNFVSPNRPNSAMDPFMRMMLREVAAGIGVSYESLSRDYSQSNYSSSRLALLDDRDLWKSLQQWFIRQFREPLHREWLQQAVLARAITEVRLDEYVADREKFEAVSFKPRGWSWVDPTKEVEAYKEAVKAGFTTISDVISQTAGGLDIEDVIQTRKRELAMLDEADIRVDTTVEEPQEPAAPAAAPDEAKSEDPEDTNEDDPPARVVSIAR